MKKTIKIIALCLSIVALTALFAGCDYLDDMKANHAIISEDKETISFNGETYKRLPENAKLYCNNNLYYYGAESVVVTDEDIPVLLSDMYCYSSDYNAINDIFCIYDVSVIEEVKEDIIYYSSTCYTDFSSTTYYCNEKDYDKYISVIENGVLDRVGFEYEIETEDYYYYYTLEVASKEVSDEILGHITNPEKMTSEVFDDKVSKDYNMEYLQYYPYKCDSEGLLAEQFDNYDIARDSEGNAYLINYLTEKAVKLSDNAAKALKDEYFYSYYQDYDYDDFYYEDDDSVGIIGGADGETEIFVANKY